MVKVSRQLLKKLVFNNANEDDLHEFDVGDLFSYDYFKKVVSLMFNEKEQIGHIAFTMQNEYLSKCNPKIVRVGNDGSSRIAFAVDGGKCLKLAINVPGLRLNELEASNSNGEKYCCFTKCYDLDDHTWFSLMTLLCSLIYANDFLDLFGVDLHHLVSILQSIVSNLVGFYKLLQLSEQAYEMLIGHLDIFLPLKNMQLSFIYDYSDKTKLNILRALIHFLKKLETSDTISYKAIRSLILFAIDNPTLLSLHDLMNIDNWGYLYSDDKSPYAIVIDPGLSDEIYDKYYGNGDYDFDNDEFISSQENGI